MRNRIPCQRDAGTRLATALRRRPFSACNKGNRRRLHAGNNARGQGFWKLNTSFLTETEYVNQIKSTIAQTIDEYSQDNTVDPGLLWEMVKMKVREVSIKYGTTKKRNLRKEQEEIEISITTLEEQLTHSDVNDKQKKQIWCDIEGRKRELERIIEYQTKGAILRSKSRWYNEGEKNTKYFLNLEKRHCKQATITQLKVSEDDFISTDKEILLECENFYKNLYTSKLDTNKNADAFFPPLEEQLRTETIEPRRTIPLRRSSKQKGMSRSIKKHGL